MLIKFVQQLLKPKDSDNDNLQAWLKEGQERLKYGDYPAAEKLLQNVLQSDPSSLDAVNSLILLYQESGDYGKAIDVLSQAVSFYPDNAYLHFNLGNFYLTLQQYSRAIICYKKSLSLQPNQAITHYNLGKALLLSGYKDKAITAMEDAGKIYFGSYQYNQAVDVYRELVELAPEKISVHIGLADSLERCGELQEAIEKYQSILKIEPDNPDIYLRLGNIYIDDQPDRAIDYYNQALKIVPDSAALYCCLGVVLKKQGKFDLAVSEFNHATELKPELSEAYYNLGLTYFEKGDIKSAAECFEKCQIINSGLPWNQAQTDPVNNISIDRTESCSRIAPLHKYQHDLEQFEYLLEKKLLPEPYSVVVDSYRELVTHYSDYEINESRSVVELPETVTKTYKQSLYVNRTPMLAGPAINPDLDVKGIENTYLGSEPNVTYIDNLLTKDAISTLQEFCFTNVIWHEVKGGYLGAYLHNGFFSELLLQIALELRNSFPAIFDSYQLQTMWAYKCDSQLTGLRTHADNAAVNVNFWVTEDEANLNPDSGGLIVYKHDAPADWGFNKYNMDSKPIEDYLQSVNSASVTVPYRKNRAVIFDSDLFHRTDDFTFREGYKNRRINITMLYGLRTS